MLDRIIAGAVPAVRAAPLSRRGFLKLSAGAAGGLMLGAALPVGRAAAEGAAEGLATPFVHIRPDNRVVVIVKHLDKGQGTATGLATLVAEELDADAAQVTTEFAPANTALYANTLMGVQGTGGSTAMANSWQQYREAGATARAMLVAAAAETWGVDPAVVTVAGGRVSAGNNSATFGDLAEAAARQTVPGEVTLKSPDQWVYIGKSFPRVDVTRKTEGSTGMFGMDARIEGMVHAVSLRSPRFGGTLATLDDSAARAMPGVIDVIRLPDRATVIAETTWAAIRARDALVAEWDFSAAENRGTEELRAEYAALLDREGTQFHAAEPTGREAAQVIEADYFFPYLAHAPMEPIDVTVRLDGTAATFWTGSQIQTLDQNIGAQVLGIAPEAVTINTLWGGGSFGRRAIYDSHYVAEAAMVAKAWLDAHGEARPIKLVWTREDDIRGGYYRPMHMHRVRAGLDAEGNIAFWQHRVVGQGIMLGTAFEPFAVKDGVDSSSVEGLGESSPYAIPGWTADVHHPRVGVPVLWWRSVGHTHTAYVVETMMDELAQAAGADPVEFRLRYLADPRARGVLEMAADKAGALPEGLTRGIAVHKSFGSYVAEVADVRMREDGKVKVVRVTCAVDCGVPPEIAVGDGAMGFWKALDEVFPGTRHQRCWVHKIANVLNKFPKSMQPTVKADLREIWQAETRAKAKAAMDIFAEKYGIKYEKAVNCLTKDRDALLAFYDFPADHWDHLRTGNPIESVFATVRHRTVRTKGALSQTTAKLMVFKLVQTAAKTWRRLKGANQLPLVIEGVTFTDGVAENDTENRAA